MTELWLKLAAAGLSLVFLVIVFLPMERVFPAQENQKFFRPAWWLDLTYFLGQYLLWTGLVFAILSHFGEWLQSGMSNDWKLMVKAQPYWLQVLEVLLFSDLLIYWGHRLQHTLPFLWRFHKVHHTTEHLDWLAAHREHPMDTIYTVGLINLPAVILGFPLSTIAGIVAFRGIWAIYIHSNVRLNIGFVKKIIGSPDLHHWHHHCDKKAGNYANLSPIMDLLFGTYHCPNHEPDKLGIEEEFPRSYVGQMIAPLLPTKVWKRVLRFKVRTTRPTLNVKR